MTDPVIAAAETAIEAAAPGLSIAKLAMPLIGGLIGAGAIGGAVLYLHHLQAAAANGHAQAVAAQDKSAVAQGQAAAIADAAVIADRGAAKADVTLHIQQENQGAILAAPGAAQGVDPGLAAALVRGLCRYDAYAGDPRCAALRAPDPPKLPPASPAGRPAGPDVR